MLLRLPTCRHRPALLIVCLLLAATGLVVPAKAQFKTVWSADELQIGQNTNLFAHWDGRALLDGVFVELPTGWTLEGALALRHGYENVPLRLRRMEREGNRSAKSHLGVPVSQRPEGNANREALRNVVKGDGEDQEDCPVPI